MLGIGSYINVDMSGAGSSDIAPMSDAECLRRFKTISIGIDSMLDRIRVGTPTVYNLADGSQSVRWDNDTGQINAWLFMQFVPEHLRELASEGLRDSLAKHERRKIDRSAVRDFVYDAHLAILRRLRDHEDWLEFAEAWRHVGFRAACDSGKYTSEQIWRAQQVV